ncbi:hypothetical protein D9M72_274780 [compost metagenome]
MSSSGASPCRAQAAKAPSPGRCGQPPISTWSKPSAATRWSACSSASGVPVRSIWQIRTKSSRCFAPMEQQESRSGASRPAGGMAQPCEVRASAPGQSPLRAWPRRLKGKRRGTSCARCCTACKIYRCAPCRWKERAGQWGRWSAVPPPVRFLPLSGSACCSRHGGTAAEGDAWTGGWRQRNGRRWW